MVTAKKPATEKVAAAKKTPSAKPDTLVAKTPAVKKKSVAKPKADPSSAQPHVVSDEQRARQLRQCGE